MRTFVLLGLVAVLILTPGSPAVVVQGQSLIRVFVDGNHVAFDQPPVVIGSRVLVPLRGIFERLGTTVEWEPATQTVLAVRGSTVVELVIGRLAAQVNNRTVALDVPAMIIGARTLVPLRFISEAMGATVQWQDETRTVLIFSSGETVGQPPAPPAPFPVAQIITGTVAQIQPGDRPTILVERGGALTRVVITLETAITRVNLSTNSGGATSLNTLKVGDDVDVRLAANAPSSEAERIRATYKVAVGRLDAITRQTRAFVLTNGDVYRIASGPVEVLINDRPSTLPNLRRGMVVTLRLNPTTNLVWGVTADTVAAQEPVVRPNRAVILSPEVGVGVASPLHISGMAEGAERVINTVDAMLGARLASTEVPVGRRGRFNVSLSYQQVQSGWPLVISVVAVNRAGLVSDPAAVNVRQR